MLMKKLGSFELGNLSAVLAAGISDLAAAVPASLLGKTRGAFNDAIMQAFIMPVAVAAISLLLSLGMERIRIEDEEPPT